MISDWLERVLRTRLDHKARRQKACALQLCHQHGVLPGTGVLRRLSGAFSDDLCTQLREPCLTVFHFGLSFTWSSA